MVVDNKNLIHLQSENWQLTSLMNSWLFICLVLHILYISIAIVWNKTLTSIFSPARQRFQCILIVVNQNLLLDICRPSAHHFWQLFWLLPLRSLLSDRLWLLGWWTVCSNLLGEDKAQIALCLKALLGLVAFLPIVVTQIDVNINFIL